MFVINADDFGYNSEYNKAVLFCFERELIHYSSLMVNMPGTEEAVSIIKERGLKNKVGLHLNLSEGRPLTSEISNDRIFCNQNGVYDRFFEKKLLYRFWLPKKTKENLEKEIIAQINKYISFGLPRKHIDSHHHVHKFYSVYRVLIKVLKKFNWETMRIALNTNKSSPSKIAYNAWINGKIKKSCVRPFSDFLFGDLQSALNSGDYCSSFCEVEVHPKMKGPFAFDHNTPLIMTNELKEK